MRSFPAISIMIGNLAENNEMAVASIMCQIGRLDEDAHAENVLM